VVVEIVDPEAPRAALDLIEEPGKTIPSGLNTGPAKDAWLAFPTGHRLNVSGVPNEVVPGLIGGVPDELEVSQRQRLGLQRASQADELPMP
jgi:hypothetical protein